MQNRRKNAIVRYLLWLDGDENRAGLFAQKAEMRRGSVIRHALFDPWNDGFGGSARLIGTGRDCADVTSAGCVVVVVFEAPAAIARLNDIARMGQVIEQRGCHLGVAEYTRPFS
jgi:hypothetical protein